MHLSSVRVIVRMAWECIFLFLSHQNVLPSQISVSSKCIPEACFLLRWQLRQLSPFSKEEADKLTTIQPTVTFFSHLLHIYVNSVCYIKRKIHGVAMKEAKNIVEAQ